LFEPLFPLVKIAPDVIVIVPVPACEIVGKLADGTVIIGPLEIAVEAELETVRTVVVPPRKSAAMS
jgi:hypothetical protein